MEGGWECITLLFLVLEEQIVWVIHLACMSQRKSELVSRLANIPLQRNVTVRFFHLLSLHRWGPCTSIPICHHQRAPLSQGRRCHEPVELHEPTLPPIYMPKRLLSQHIPKTSPWKLMWNVMESSGSDEETYRKEVSWWCVTSDYSIRSDKICGRLAFIF